MTQPPEKKEFNLEKAKFWLEVAKWVIGGVVIALITLFIDNRFKERNAGLQEMQAFDKYVEIILKADNIEERWKLTEFFSTVTPTDRLRDRWLEYKKVITPYYNKFDSLKKVEDSLRLKAEQQQTPEIINGLIKIKRQLEPYEKKLADPVNAQAKTNVPSAFNNTELHILRVVVNWESEKDKYGQMPMMIYDTAQIEVSGVNYKSYGEPRESRFIKELPSGKYKVTVTKQGYKTVVRDVVLNDIGQTVFIQLIRDRSMSLDPNMYEKPPPPGIW